MNKFQGSLLSFAMANACFLSADSLEQKMIDQDDPFYGCEAQNDCDLFSRKRSTFFANVELLYWTVNEGATDFALKMKHRPWSATDTCYAFGHYKNAKFDWSPGLRASFGHFNAAHYWDVKAQYTWLHVGGKKETHAPKAPGRFLVGTWIGPNFQQTTDAIPLKEAESKMDFNYNVADILVSRRFHSNPHLRFALFGGVTGALIDQTWKVVYTDTSGNRSRIKNTWSFVGAGLRGGGVVDWYMGTGDIYLTGLASSAVLSGAYKNRAKMRTNAPFASAGSVDRSRPCMDGLLKDVRLAYTAQFSLAPSWQKSYKNMRTGVYVGYEFTIWANLHNIYRSDQTAPTAGKDTLSINSSLVCLQGLFVRWNIDF